MNKKTIIHPYVPAMINRIEIWLTVMALNGWTVIDFSGWKFTFEEKAPKKIEYFMYSGFDASRGFSYNYYRAKEQYGNNKAKINKSNTGVFEIDTTKKDNNFNKIRVVRNTYYKTHYVKLLIISLVFCLGALLIVLCEPNAWGLLFPWVIILVYAIVSLWLILNDTKPEGTDRNH